MALLNYRLTENDSSTPSRPRPPRSAFSRRSIAVLPTLFTLGNLLCGFAAVFSASRPVDTVLPLGWTPLTFAALWVFAGLVLDGLDGRIARMTRSESELGEQLDSMADMVTFGVAPAFICVQLVGIDTPFFGLSDTLYDRLALVIAGIYVACAGLRLARFNMDTGTDDHRSFKGLPSPGAAGAVASLVLLHQRFLAQEAPSWTLTAASGTMLLITLLVAIAMVSQFHYVHVMTRYVRGRAPFATLAAAIICGLLLVVLPQWSLAVGFVGYAVSAPLRATYRWFMGRGPIVEDDEEEENGSEDRVAG